MEQKTILITGFGPFQNHSVNASWEAVKLLLKSCQDLETFYDVKIVGLEIPVDYKVVSDLVPKLWEKYKPMFVLHVGVSGKAKLLTLESTAHGFGYVRPDITNKLPDENELQCAIFHPSLDIKALSKNINDNFEESYCKAIVSHDAGRYLCEYIFYKSLSVDSSRVLFVHIPDFNVYPSDQSSKGLHYIIQYLLKYSIFD